MLQLLHMCTPSWVGFIFCNWKDINQHEVAKHIQSIWYHYIESVTVAYSAPNTWPSAKSSTKETGYPFVPCAAFSFSNLSCSPNLSRHNLSVFLYLW